eukprot:TRINITY_DN93368_c0_g1_i1.p1 TRINITY_DN93368_c0_g1~~TRINITY_DN93368_c0_g1_i1.p1  ORF type:complete len:831 (-),score=185.78 TRINITY_DN93368_c0_g1_i1:160-2652(-)
MGATCCKDDVRFEKAAYGRQVSENVMADREGLVLSPAPLPASAASSSTSEGKNINFLKQVELFTRLPEDQLPTLALACKETIFRSEEVVIRQGDEHGDAFFIIKSGEANVDVSGKLVATLGSGDYFGEICLLRDEARTATITAKTSLVTLMITRKLFEEFGLREKLEFEKRKAVVPGAINEVVVKPPSPKSAEEQRLISEALRSNKNLASIVKLDDKRIAQMSDVAWKESVSSGTEIITAGSLNADYFYIVQSGLFEVWIAQTSGSQGRKRSKELVAHGEASSALVTLHAGSSFGELALLYHAPRAATVVAREDSVVWVIDRKQFKQILEKSGEDIVKEHAALLKQVPGLDFLKDSEQKALAGSLREIVLMKDETVYEQEEKANALYLLSEGQVSIVKDGKEPSEVIVGHAGEFRCFGEKALLGNQAYAETIRVSSETRMLMLERQSLEMVLGPLEELKKRDKKERASVKAETATGKSYKSAAGASGHSPTKGDSRFGKILRKDLKDIGLLGCGAFGSVSLVEHVPSSQTYALKALSKGFIIKSNMQQCVMSEKDIQVSCHSPFIIKLLETYNSAQFLYMLLELAQGGELYELYNKKGLYGREELARFYTAGVTLAFEHMHLKRIVYRDLKTENLLLTEKGHIKLADFGLAKVVVGKTFTTCGTPDYFAPEIINSQGHTNAVDWWALGILTFELLAGQTPFESDTPMQTYSKIARGISKVNFPRKCKGAAGDLIRSLCQPEPSRRLPMKKGGSNNLKIHPFFKVVNSLTGVEEFFDWQRFAELRMKPPYMPKVRDKRDMSNFFARKEDKPPEVPYEDDQSGWDEGFATSS